MTDDSAALFDLLNACSSELVRDDGKADAKADV